ncbi:hypothetical protein [Streptomyces microflavus]|uniref:hypothetical protein n=1 Tax=Streptomyces microflavus TaxID=1919 RepID=UPI00331CF79D
MDGPSADQLAALVELGMGWATLVTTPQTAWPALTVFLHGDRAPDLLEARGTVLLLGAGQMGPSHSSIPEPGTIRAYLQALPASTPAINKNSPWLFPGRRASQPMNPATLRDAPRELGIPAEKGRTSAIRQLVLQAPALVIALALGYHDKTTRIAAEAGAPWKSYAPGDHTG